MTKFYRAGVGDINLTINQRDLSLIRNSSLCIKQLPKNPAFELALPWEKNKKKEKKKAAISPASCNHRKMQNGDKNQRWSCATDNKTLSVSSTCPGGARFESCFPARVARRPEGKARQARLRSLPIIARSCRRRNNFHETWRNTRRG